jgi:hypothetical protein
MLTGSEVALIVAGAALIGTAATIAQNRVFNRRDALWQRMQWALEHVLAPGEHDDLDRTAGLVMLKALQASRLATDEERAMLEELAEAMLPPNPGDQHD